MQYFRFLTKISGQAHLRALVLQSSNASDAGKRAKELLVANEKILVDNPREAFLIPTGSFLC